MKKALLAFVFFVTISSFASAQQRSGKPLFTERVSMCAGRGFIAMVPFSRPQSLTIISVTDEGIGSPQTIPTTGNEVLGLQCMGSHLELQVHEAGSDHFSVLTFRILDGAVQAEPREDINWSISRNGTMPSAIERRIERFDRGISAGMRGDWYFAVGSAPGRIYELHYVITHLGGTSKLTVDLLSETYDYKIVQTIPLIQLEEAEEGD